METLPKKSIDLTDLVLFLKSKGPEHSAFDDSHFQIIEEVSYLCVDIDFNVAISLFRERLKKRFPRLNIPTKSCDQAQEILKFLYENWTPFYQEGINKIINDFKLLPTLYWMDHSTNPETSLHLRLSLLDSIVLTNRLFSVKEDAYPFWVNPYLTKKPLIEVKIEIEKFPIPYLNISFPAYSNLGELKQLLTENYERIEAIQAKELPFNGKRDSRRKDLTKILDAYLLSEQGKTSAQISIELDKEYGGEMMPDSVDRLLRRFKNESSKFKKHDGQHT